MSLKRVDVDETQHQNSINRTKRNKVQQVKRSSQQQKQQIQLSSQQQQQLQQTQKQCSLTYDKNLLNTINNTCMRDDEEIVLLDYFQPKERYIHTFNTDDVNYVLVMNVNGRPVSQIHYGLKENEDFSVLNISSVTPYLKRKQSYNTILRCVTVLLAPTMRTKGRPIQKIMSKAQNALSVYSLLKLGFDYDLEYDQDGNPINTQDYNPYQVQEKIKTKQLTQTDRVAKQKHLREYIEAFMDKIHNASEINMYLDRKDFKKAGLLARKGLERKLGCNLD